MLRIHLYMAENQKITAEINRPKAGDGFRRYTLSPSSWNRLMYLVAKYDGFMFPNPMCFTSETKDAGKDWYLHISIDNEQNDGLSC